MANSCKTVARLITAAQC